MHLPPTLTPIERQLIATIQQLDRDMRTRAEHQDTRISQLEVKIDARDRSIASLNASLRCLVGPLDLDGSSPD